MPGSLVLVFLLLTPDRLDKGVIARFLVEKMEKFRDGLVANREHWVRMLDLYIQKLERDGKQGSKELVDEAYRMLAILQPGMEGESGGARTAPAEVEGVAVRRTSPPRWSDPYYICPDGPPEG